MPVLLYLFLLPQNMKLVQQDLAFQVIGLIKLLSVLHSIKFI
jgi:hypothetical protein